MMDRRSTKLAAQSMSMVTLSTNVSASREKPMRGTNKAKEMKRRASQRRATHKARLAALRVRAETRIAAVEAERGKQKVGSKRSIKAAAKASKSKKR